MSAVLSTKPQAQGSDVSLKLNFQKNLQTVTNRIHATNNIDEIMLEVSQEICTLFNADRLTIYTIAEDKTSIISKVKTGLNSFKDLKLPIAEHSIAGYVAHAASARHRVESRNGNLVTQSLTVLCGPVLDQCPGERVHL